MTGPPESGIATIDCRKWQIANVTSELNVATASRDKTILAWTNDGSYQFLAPGGPPDASANFQHSTQLTAACLSPDGTRAVLADVEGNLVVVDREPAASHVVPRRFENVASLALAFDNQTLAVGQQDGRVEVLDFESDQPVKSIALAAGAIKTAFSPNGELLVVADQFDGPSRSTQARPPRHRLGRIGGRDPWRRV